MLHVPKISQFFRGIVIFHDQSDLCWEYDGVFRSSGGWLMSKITVNDAGWTNEHWFTNNYISAATTASTDQKSNKQRKEGNGSKVSSGEFRNIPRLEHPLQCLVCLKRYIAFSKVECSLDFGKIEILKEDERKTLLIMNQPQLLYYRI